MSRIKRKASSLAADWARVSAKIKSSRRVIVFLDFDGTLVPIAPRPDQVRLAPATRRVLRRLASHPRVTIILISGRRRAELHRYVGLPGIRYFGLYGWDRSGHSPLPGSARIALRKARTLLSSRLLSIPGLWIENKKFSLSVHFLEVSPAAQPPARRKLRSLLLPFQGTLSVIENIRDTEIVPCSVQGKGITVQRFLDEPANSDAIPFYFGDDLSDESAFEAVGKGISVCVGAARPTFARYSIRDPAAVAEVLAKLEAELN